MSAPDREPPHRLEDGEHEGSDGLDALPGMARLAFTAWWHTTGWALRNSVKVPRLMLDLTRSPEKAVELAKDLREMVPDILSSPTDHPRPRGGSPNGAAAEQQHRAKEARSLRDEGESLLQKSRDVRFEVDAHPAYERILSELAPDEGRILRLLLLEGPQPSVDVRTGGPIGMMRSRLLAPGLSMIGARAGCRYVERVPSYLNNLFRLGLVWFSRETLRDPMRYQVLEAQPDVLEGIHSVRQAKVVRRSIHLTPFGEDFCRVCLAPDQELASLPRHSTPRVSSSSPGPPSDVVPDL